jgi:prevent-host-death family protein
VRSISYLKARAADIVDQLDAGGAALTITKNGEACAVLQSYADFEQTQETLALLKILALGQRQIEAGEVEDAAVVLKRLRARLGKA